MQGLSDCVSYRQELFGRYAVAKRDEQATFLPEEVFSFEIERTDEPLVARGGLVLPHQMAQAMDLPKKIDQELPSPGSPRGAPPSAYVIPLMLMLHGGGRALEDLRELRAEV